jgi:hypothetical protein
MARQVAPGSDTTVWAGHIVKYQLEEWSTSGRLLQTLTLDRPWFPDVERGGFIAPDAPPNPSLRALHRDRGGRLWAITWIADDDWESAIGEGTDPYGREYQTYQNPADYFDSVVEVIDPEAGRVVGKARLDMAATGFVEDGVVFGYDEDDSGEPLALVLEIGPP